MMKYKFLLLPFPRVLLNLLTRPNWFTTLMVFKAIKKTVQGCKFQKGSIGALNPFELSEEIPIILQKSYWIYNLWHAIELDFFIGHDILQEFVHAEVVLGSESIQHPN